MTQRQPVMDRRRALKAIGLGVGAAAISGQAVQAAQSQPDQPAPSSAESRYRASEHVLTYYATLSEQGG
ncbi:twin-arginine translocation signal domain-containing protein [uncultured Ferrimonas sp.]|uniref:twin-arginine translocation signal domain-containing protein n=1 Tax=uncultured Ferrimonas sp. TaxID=432640 RepID=UPI00260C6E68|nr:twin-arginine translocation signal domain-containing protein [uncultured Ferrimonas sp.]